MARWALFLVVASGCAMQLHHATDLQIQTEHEIHTALQQIEHEEQQVEQQVERDLGHEEELLLLLLDRCTCCCPRR